MAEVDGIELRDQMAEDYCRNMKRLGGDLSMEHARQLATDDLNLVDRLERETKPAFSSSPQALTEVEEEKEDVATKMAREQGDRFERREVTEDEPIKTVDQIRKEVGEQKFAMLKRIQMLLTSEKALSYKDPTKVEFLGGKLAQEFIALQADYTFRKGVFKGLDDRNRDNCWIRKAMDICDRSNSFLPNWWVK